LLSLIGQQSHFPHAGGAYLIEDLPDPAPFRPAIGPDVDLALAAHAAQALKNLALRASGATLSFPKKTSPVRMIPTSNASSRSACRMGRAWPTFGKSMLTPWQIIVEAVEKMTSNRTDITTKVNENVVRSVPAMGLIEVARRFRMPA
jgi:hypothetical protein